MKKRALLMLLLLAYFINAHAQSIYPATVNSSGGSATIGSSTYEWSVGEMTLVNTFSGSSAVLTQGILQPTYYLPTKVSDPVVAQEVQVYPNPTTSEIHIRVQTSQAGLWYYRLTDISGKMISDQSVQVAPGISTSQINVAQLADGTYLLEVSQKTESGVHHTSYKIEKIN